MAGRPGIGNRPNVKLPSIGQINTGNTVINNRPNWANINNNQITNINNRWQNQVGGIQNWHVNHPNRLVGWNRWGNGVRSHWAHSPYHHRWFGPRWWGSHPFGFGGWHYYHRFAAYPWRFWWTVPTFAALTNWFTWQAPPAVWTQPVYYDYGQGGNVVYQDNSVYVNGKQVATKDEFAQSAAALATVPPPKDDAEAEAAEWLPLGTFAITTDEDDVSPVRAMQLAVNKAGVISGTLFNNNTDQAQAVQGQVDKQTQRVAFRIGENENVVYETGLYNLTQEEAPVLVHFGTDKTETYMLVRLEAPDEGADDDEEGDESAEETAGDDGSNAEGQ